MPTTPAPCRAASFRAEVPVRHAGGSGRFGGRIKEWQYVIP
jgi:hypothetical protein